MLTASQIMSDHFVAVQSTTSLDRAIESLIDEKAAILLVVSGETLVGTISDSVLLQAALDSQMRQSPISLNMTRQFVSVPEHAPMDFVLDQFVLHDLQSIPVVDGKQLRGVITRLDLLRAVFGKKEQSVPHHA